MPLWKNNSAADGVYSFVNLLGNTTFDVFVSLGLQVMLPDGAPHPSGRITVAVSSVRAFVEYSQRTCRGCLCTAVLG